MYTLGCDFLETEAAIKFDGCLHRIRLGVEAQSRVVQAAGDCEDALDKCLSQPLAAELWHDMEPFHLARALERKWTQSRAAGGLIFCGGEQQCASRHGVAAGKFLSFPIRKAQPCWKLQLVVANLRANLLELVSGCNFDDLGHRSHLRQLSPSKCRR